MAKARLLAPWVGEERRSAFYHVVSRTIHQQFLLHDAEKEQFVKLMRLYEAFCGVRVLSFCVMSNHFHILVEVPPRMDDSLSDEALLTRLELLYSKDYVAQVRMQLSNLASSETSAGKLAYAKLREKFTSRMWDLGKFMQTLKQCFTHWYNARHGRRGTLWEARYKSVLVENGHAARVMAAYIDLNPIRAAIVKKPEAYRWCSYAEAVVGGERGELARRGIARVLQERDESVAMKDADSAYDGWEGFPEPVLEHYAWRSVAQRYRLILFEDGEEVINVQGKQVRKGMSKEQKDVVEKREGQMNLAEKLRCKTRYFVDGGVIGGKEFVREVVNCLKGNYLSEDRKNSGNKMLKGKDDIETLWSMRRLSNE